MAWDRDNYPSSEIRKWEIEKAWQDLADKFFVTDFSRKTFLFMNLDPRLINERKGNA